MPTSYSYFEEEIRLPLKIGAVSVRSVDEDNKERERFKQNRRLGLNMITYRNEYRFLNNSLQEIDTNNHPIAVIQASDNPSEGAPRLGDRLIARQLNKRKVEGTESSIK